MFQTKKKRALKKQRQLNSRGGSRSGHASTGGNSDSIISASVVTATPVEEVPAKEEKAVIFSLPRTDMDNTKSRYNDKLADMTIGRRISRQLYALNAFYDPNEDVEAMKKRKARPNIDKAWEYFEHNVLPRCLVQGNKSTRDLAAAKGIEAKYDKAEVGEFEKPTMLYPVWDTPIDDMADFGIGVALYFSTLRFLAVLCLVAFWLNSSTMRYFASKDYDADNEDDVKWSLWGSADCSHTKWEVCPTCTEDEWKGLAWATFPGTSDRLATGTNANGEEVKFLERNQCTMEGMDGFYPFYTIGTLVLIVGTVFYWIYSQKQRIKAFDDAENSSSDYTIEVKNPPPIDSSFSPEVWKEWFETTFRGDDDDIEVAAVTIALDNERLINALVDRRALIREYQNILEDVDEFDIDDIEDYLKDLPPLPAWKKSLEIGTDPADLVKGIQNASKLVNELSAKEYEAASIFVTFQTQYQQAMVLDRLSTPVLGERKIESKYLYKGEQLKVAEPAEPSALRWGQLNVDFTARFAQIAFTTVVALLLVLGGGIAISYARSISPSIAGYLITALNILTPRVVSALTKIESHPNESSVMASQYLKITAFRWTNTVLIFCIISPFTDTLMEDSLIEGIAKVFTLDLFLRPTLQYLNIGGNIGKHLKAPKAKRQRTMNLFFKADSYDIGERQTNITTIFFFTLFYSAIYPMGYFFAFAIFTVKYWLDKFCILRSWGQGPKIGTSVAKISNVFYLLALICFAIQTFYSYAMFPYDNACHVDTSDGSYTGSWNLTRMDGEEITDSVLVSDGHSEYKFCEQNSIRSIPFPPTPTNLVGLTSDWMSTKREPTAYNLALCMLVSLVVIGASLLVNTVVRGYNILFGVESSIESMSEEERIDLEAVRFSHIDEIHAYIPQIKIEGYLFPFLLCDVDYINEDMIGWDDPDTHYDAYNLIYDIPRLAQQKSKERTLHRLGEFVSDENNDGELDDDGNNAPIFSIAKSWTPYENKKSSKKQGYTRNNPDENTPLID